MYVIEKEFSLPAVEGHKDLLGYLRRKVTSEAGGGQVPVRFVVSGSDDKSYTCELGLIMDYSGPKNPDVFSIFDFKKRKHENTGKFNAVFLVPTGIGSEIGGHAGDAGPVSRLLASVCDTLITHPNVVNASDINELPDNGLYVEGSIICRLMMGTAGLHPVRSNRVLIVMDDHEDEAFSEAAINSVNGAMAACGYNYAGVVKLDPPVKMKSAYTKSGSAAGRVEGIKNLFQVFEEYRGEFDAVALSSIIKVPLDYHMDYFASEGSMVNPWGGVEAILTHTVSMIYNFPSAHAPMLENEIIANLDPGIVDPRMAAEAVSTTYLHCVLKGLHKSPRIITDKNLMQRQDVISAEDISCLVIPDGCIGLPTLAALEQGIPVIAVRENRNKMKNNLSALPWQEDGLITVENYWEAAGVMNALKAGVAPESVRRPLKSVDIVSVSGNRKMDDPEEKIAETASAEKK